MVIESINILDIDLNSSYLKNKLLFIVIIKCIINLYIIQYSFQQDSFTKLHLFIQQTLLQKEAHLQNSGDTAALTEIRKLLSR